MRLLAKLAAADGGMQKLDFYCHQVPLLHNNTSAACVSTTRQRFCPLVTIVVPTSRLANSIHVCLLRIHLTNRIFRVDRALIVLTLLCECLRAIK